MLEKICPKARPFVLMISLSVFALPALEIFNPGDSSDKPHCPHPLQGGFYSEVQPPVTPILGKTVVFTMLALNQSTVSQPQPGVKYL